MLPLPAHDSGLVWVANPSPWDTFSPYYLPVLTGALKNERLTPIPFRLHLHQQVQQIVILNPHRKFIFSRASTIFDLPNQGPDAGTSVISEIPE